jgi:hypothetical protein
LTLTFFFIHILFLALFNDKTHEYRGFCRFLNLLDYLKIVVKNFFISFQDEVSAAAL